MTRLWQDVRYAVRGLQRAPVFSLAVIATLAVTGAADPVGQRMACGNTASHGRWMRIVGGVGDVKQGALNAETVPHTYTPWLQVSDAMMADNIVGMMRSLGIAVRGEVEPGALAGTVRARIRALDPALPVACFSRSAHGIR